MCHVITPWEPPLPMMSHLMTSHPMTPRPMTSPIMCEPAIIANAVCGFPHENSCQTPIKREWNAEVRTMRFALTEKSCNLIGPFVPRDLYTRR